MKEDNLNETWVVVTNQEAADTLVEPKKRRYLEPFIRQECSLQEAAEELGVKPNAMYYQVKRLLHLKLLKIVRLQKRKGKASPIYRSSAQKFFVPFVSTSASTIEDLLFELEVESLRTIIRRFLHITSHQATQWGLGFSLASDRKLEIDFLSQDQTFGKKDQLLNTDFPSILNDYMTVRLNPGVAKQVQQALYALEQSTREQSSAEAEPYLIHLAIVPLLG